MATAAATVAPPAPPPAHTGPSVAAATIALAEHQNQAPQSPSEIELLREYAAVRQIEFYLSRENLVTDYFLLQHLDSEYWVDLAVLADFPKMKQIGIIDVHRLASILPTRSAVLEVRERTSPPPTNTGKRTPTSPFLVRPAFASPLFAHGQGPSTASVADKAAVATNSIAPTGVPAAVDSEVSAMILIRDVPEATVVDDILGLLCNAPSQALGMKPDLGGSLWVLTYPTPEDARSVHAFLQDKQLRGEPVKARVKLENRLLRLVAEATAPENAAAAAASATPETNTSTAPTMPSTVYYYSEEYVPASIVGRRESAPAGSQYFVGNRKGSGMGSAARPGSTRQRSNDSAARVAGTRPHPAALPMQSLGRSDMSRAPRPRGGRQGGIPGGRGPPRGGRPGLSQRDVTKGVAEARNPRVLDSDKDAHAPPSAAPELTESQFPPLATGSVSIVSSEPVRDSSEDSNFAAKVAAAVVAARDPATSDDNCGTETPQSDDCDNDGNVSSGTGTANEGLHISMTSSLTPSPTPSVRIDQDSEEASVPITISEGENQARAAVEIAANGAAPGSYAAALLTTKNGQTPDEPSSHIHPDNGKLVISIDEGVRAMEATETTKPTDEDRGRGKSVWANKPSTIYQAPPAPVTPKPAPAPAPAPGPSRKPEEADDPPKTETEPIRRRPSKGANAPRPQKRHSHRPAHKSSEAESHQHKFVRAPSPPPPVLTGDWAKGSLLSAFVKNASPET